MCRRRRITVNIKREERLILSIFWGSLCFVKFWTTIVILQRHWLASDNFRSLDQGALRVLQGAITISFHLKFFTGRPHVYPCWRIETGMPLCQNRAMRYLENTLDWCKWDSMYDTWIFDESAIRNIRSSRRVRGVYITYVQRKRRVESRNGLNKQDKKN
jgi:hypothetical protein